MGKGWPKTTKEDKTREGRGVEEAKNAIRPPKGL